MLKQQETKLVITYVSLDLHLAHPYMYLFAQREL